LADQNIHHSAATSQRNIRHLERFARRWPCFFSDAYRTPTQPPQATPFVEGRNAAFAYDPVVMSDAKPGDIVGKIKRRLLVNTWVDPDEAARHLPDGVRPHLGTNGGVVVGCCMIEIESARPWPLRLTCV
jgi:hypothetical protein